MKRLLACVGCAVLLGAALLAHQTSQSASNATCWVTLRLLDATTRKPISGLIRLSQGKDVLHPPELLSRGVGLPSDQPIADWCVVPEAGATVMLPPAKLAIQAMSGVESEFMEGMVDLTGNDAFDVDVVVKHFSNLRAQGLVAGNTHLHLMKLDRAVADRYLTEVPRADGLDVLFLSYLERAEADKEYISNRYTRDDLERLSRGKTQFGNGEEHRHNFGPQAEGFGHVMFLDLKELVVPVSIGPGIMQLGTDGLPVQRGIDQAKKQGATVVWCHNHWGLENVPNWVTGRLDAQNIFDGGEHGSYQDSFYRYLNAGLHVPFSTGTDWFLYDFSRVYVPLDGPVTPRNWLAALKAGRSFITNGPLLELTVDGAKLGDRIDLKESRGVAVSARAVGRVDFRQLELVQNGQVVEAVPSRKVENHFVAELHTNLPVNAPCWVAVRTPPPPLTKSPQTPQNIKHPVNEFNQALFSHSSPIYVSLSGKEVFDAVVARELLAGVERNRSTIVRDAKFADDIERQRVLIVYDEAIETLRGWIAEKR